MKNIIRVDFPGYINNIDNALELFGGINKVKEALLSKNKNLSLNFRPNNNFSNNNLSRIKDECSILIKIKAKKTYSIKNGKKNLISISFHPELTIPSTKTIYFDRPSDFQFLPPLNSHFNQESVINPPKFKFLYLPPKSFFKSSKYDSIYIQRKIFAAQNDKIKLWSKDKCPWVVKHTDLVGQKHGPKKCAASNDIKEDIHEVIVQLFEDRPIWTSLALIDYLVRNNLNLVEKYNISENSNKIMYNTLSNIGYYISDGPFNLCWVKYGLNPIYQCSIRSFQPINISMKSWKHADKLIKYVNNIKKNSKKDEYIIGFSSLSKIPDRLLFSLQICDLKERYINEKSLQFLSEFDNNSGWYSKEDLALMRKFCMIKIKRMLNNDCVEQEYMMDDIINDDDVNANYIEDDDENDYSETEIPTKTTTFFKEVENIMEKAEFENIDADLFTNKYHIYNTSMRLFNY